MESYREVLVMGSALLAVALYGFLQGHRGLAKFFLIIGLCVVGYAFSLAAR